MAIKRKAREAGMLTGCYVVQKVHHEDAGGAATAGGLRRRRGTRRRPPPCCANPKRCWRGSIRVAEVRAVQRGGGGGGGK
jgi:hypothetical protein